MMHKLVFKWTVSRGRDTYGYNICSLYVDDRKVSSCNGGGYDMKGKSLGNWVAERFSDELMKLEIPMGRRNGEEIQEYYGLSYHDPDFDPGKAIVGEGCSDRTLGKEAGGKTVKQAENDGESLGLERYQAFYRASSSVPTERHTVPLIDGACGFSSVERIVNALGYGLEYIHQTAKEVIYTLDRIEKVG